MTLSEAIVQKKKRTTKDFYHHIDTGAILVMERRADGVIVGSCPASEPPKDVDGYECKPDNNLWVQENSHKLILYEAGG